MRDFIPIYSVIAMRSAIVTTTPLMSSLNSATSLQPAMLIMTAPPVSQEMSNVGKHWVETAPYRLLLLQLQPLRRQLRVGMTWVCHSSHPVITTSYSNCLIQIEYLFVVGGLNERQSTELVSLTDGSTIPDCLDALSEHPNELSCSAGGALPDVGKIILFYLAKTCKKFLSVAFIGMSMII